jgi:hypothetical protein
MALSPADYAAYSRATGTPYPEDPEEKAQVAPEVLEFRRNQLRAPQEESNLPGILGAAALGLGALAGGMRLAGSLGRKRTQVAPSTPPPVTPKGAQSVQNIKETDRVRTAENFARQARAERPTGVVQTDLNQQNLEDFIRSSPAFGRVPTREPRESAAPGIVRSLPAAAERPDLLAGLTADPGYAQEFVASRVAEQMAGDLIDEVNAFSNPAARSELARQQASVQGQKRKDLWDLVGQIRNESLVTTQEAIRPVVSNQALSALESGEDQMTGRMKAQLSRNEDLDMSQVEMLENSAQVNPSRMSAYVPDEAINRAAAQLPDGIPVDQAEGLTVRDLVRQGKPILDVRQNQAVRISPRALGLEQEQDPLVQEARQYLRSQEVDTDFDYSAENIRQAAQVRDRIQRAKTLQSEANQILAELQAESPVISQQLSPQEFAAAFNKKYREELNPELRDVDNARQRAELLAAQAANLGEDVESLLLGEKGVIDTNMRGRSLRGGKINALGDIIYQDIGGTFASADTGLKARQEQGAQYKARAERLNKLRSASDAELTDLVLQGQQALANNQSITKLDADTTRFASQLLQTRAVNNPEPTRLQLDALDRARASIAATQEILQGSRNLRPTLAPGPAQDVARSMETLRRGMIVDPSEPLPVLPSVQQLRTGYASDEEIGPILGASDVYTGAAAEAAGPVIFTGKSKANTVLRTPPITGSIGTPTGRYLTQDNPDVLGTVYNVAGTRANRDIAAQVEVNSQAFLADAIAGGLQAKGLRAAEPYVTPARLPGPIPPPAQGPSRPPLGMPGIDPSKRTLYSQYRQGVSATTPLSPFIGEMSGGTVVVAPPTTASLGIRRDIGAPAQSIDLTRRGEKSRYFSLYPQQEFVTGIEPAPIGPITQSAGLSRIGGMAQRTVQGAGGLPVTQLTPQGQRIAYPRMDKPAKALGFRGETITNVPRYGINPGAEDWRDDLMRSAYRRGGPIRTYQG